MNLEVHAGKGLQVSELPIEIIERKGVGHPDSLCDRASEELSIKISRYYLENYGRVFHHNVDKCVLVGGQSNAYFGGGELIEPIYLLLVGRAIGKVGKKPVPIGKFAVSHTKEWLSKTLRYLDVESDIVIHSMVRSGSVDLVGTFDRSGVPKANDTSIGVSYAPFSETEKLVYETEKLLNSAAIKKKYPAIGEDIKVMGVRNGNRINLTIACAMISSEIPDAKSYMELKDKIKELVLGLAKKTTKKEVSVAVNNADDPKSGIYYLTVTGTSAEHGDDGQVGRGNRANGLITPYRPMTMEAAAGKNPINHVGKIYNVSARKIVETLVKEEKSITEANCYIVSQIGEPINKPQAINVEVYSDEPLPKIRKTAEAIAAEVMKEMPETWRGFLERKYELF